MCDESNINQFGASLLSFFLRAIGKTELAGFDQAGIKSEFLASNAVLLRELVNSNFDHAVKICEEHEGDTNYDLLEGRIQEKR